MQADAGTAKGMFATALAKTPLQSAAVGIKEYHLHRQLPRLLQFPHHLWHPRQIGRDIASINTHRSLGNAARAAAGLVQDALSQCWQQGCRQVINAVIAAVFQDMQHGALAGAGSAADDSQSHLGHR